MVKSWRGNGRDPFVAADGAFHSVGPKRAEDAGLNSDSDLRTGNARSG